MKQFFVIFCSIFLLNLGFAGELSSEINQFKNRSSKKKTPEQEKRQKLFQKATSDLRKSKLKKEPKKNGADVPEFSINGKSISSFYKKRPIIIKFYRGHWCPYCLLELKHYQKKISEINQYGQIIALVPDEEKFIKKTKKKLGLTFPIYQDKDNHIAKKFGLAFTVNSEVLDIYKNKFKIDLAKSQGNSGKELPMPGTYVVNTKGEIVYAFFDADYTVRAEPSEVIAALKKAK